MSHPKHAQTDNPVHPLITQRWSPYAYSDKPVAKPDLLALFEAARWAASSYNEQPWVFLVATKDEPEDFKRNVLKLLDYIDKKVQINILRFLLVVIW
jgi:nitroreductase